MRKSMLGGVISAVLFLTACAPTSPVYDNAQWIDDSANGIAINMSNVKIEEGLSSTVKDNINQYIEELDGIKFASLQFTGTIGAFVFTQYNEYALLSGTSKSPILTMHKPLSVPATCDISVTSVYQLLKNYRYQDMLIELRESTPDYSFTTYKQTVLVYKIEKHESLKTNIVIIEHDKSRKLKKISIAITSAVIGENFAQSYNEALNNEEIIYSAGFFDASNYSKNDLTVEDKKNIPIARIPMSLFNDNLYSFDIKEDGKIVLQEIFIKNNTCSLGKKYEF